MTEENPRFDPAKMGIDLADVTQAAGFLRSGFSWSRSKQGAEYWITVIRNLYEIRDELYARAQIEKEES